LHSPRVLSPRLFLKTNWKRRSEGRDLWLSPPIGFEKEMRREENAIEISPLSVCLGLSALSLSTELLIQSEPHPVRQLS
jgi:hypothetical protein